MNQTGDFFLVKSLIAFWHFQRPREHIAIQAKDALGRKANADVFVDERCDHDPPVHFKKRYYEYVFSNCSSRAEDEVLGRIEAAGNSTYGFEFREIHNRCDMVEVKYHTGYVTFGPKLCHEKPNPCCHRGQEYSGFVYLLDKRSGRPSNERARLQVTNIC